jgi:cyclopropane-fatty-acyl-phospholipid synthase
MIPIHGADLKMDTSCLSNRVINNDWFTRFCQNKILKLFSTFTHGELELVLPEGTTKKFGKSLPVLENARIEVLSTEFFKQLVLGGDIGLAESYIAGQCDTPCVKAVLKWFILNTGEHSSLKGSSHIKTLHWFRWINQINHKLRPNSLANSPNNIQVHYDLGNTFFSLFLDSTMAYSSGKFTYSGQALQQAQLAKYEALCQKLKLKSSDHVLEIGSGWGGLALYMAQNFGCRIQTITLSKEQYAYVQDRVHSHRLQDKIQVVLQDYRETTGMFDKIVSVEMIEAVGEDYLNTFISTCNKRLKPTGLIVLQMITCPDNRYNLLKANVDFIQKHIFPGSLLPSLRRIQSAFEYAGKGLQLFELEDLGLSYAKTLHHWNESFLQKQDELTELGFDTFFIRKWHYYFKYCQAAFETRNISVVQAVYTRANNPDLMQTAAQ